MTDFDRNPRAIPYTDHETEDQPHVRRRHWVETTRAVGAIVIHDDPDGPLECDCYECE